jgi:nucleoside-diphosphate-sugar epimerase
MKALVTGAGGFLGGGLAKALRARGDEVRGFSRGEYPHLTELGVEHVRGDVGDAEAVARAVEGVDVVFHVAAKVSASGAYEEFHATNVVGAKNVVEACQAAGVKALVYTSTPSVAFGPEDIEGADESIGYSEHFDALYAQTKAEAEKQVLAADGESLRTVAIRPHIVWGPGDTSLLPRVLERGRAGILRRIEDGGPPKRVDITYIDDAVQAHLLAAEKLLAGGEVADTIAGKPYFVSSGSPVEIWSFVDRLLGAAKIPPVKKSVSPKMAMAAGWVFETVHNVLGRDGEPRMSTWIVRELTTSRWFDISAAKRDLGYEPKVDLEEGLRRLTAWLDERGGEARV